MNGAISAWNDSKGFGFITPDNQSEQVFFHISAVKNNSRRPQKGDRVVFESSRDAQNRLKAKYVLLEGEPVRRKSAGISQSPMQSKAKLASRVVNSRLILLFAALLVIGLIFKSPLLSLYQPDSAQPGRSSGYPASQQHSPELKHTLQLIERNGPFPYSQDGSVFQNRERHLPGKPRGYYHEYTVKTPGLNHRGARRVVTGGNPPVVFYYTQDHYNSFRIIESH
jgi:ribonuclease T1